MAQIGTFTRDDNGAFAGTIKTLTLNVKATIKPCERDNDKAPDYRVTANGVEFGAGWSRTARETGAEYLSLKLDDPSFTAPVYASLVQADKGEQGPGAPYNAAAKFYQLYAGDSADDHDLRIAHVAIDRQHTTMTDSGSWFPLPALRALAAQGVCQLAPRFYGFPTNRSQRHTREVDAPDLLARCQADGVDAVLLVANCPVCHQSLTLAARHLEAHGIASVVLGCARDVVERCGAPRLLFSDFPLGNAAGLPHDPASQRATLLLALTLLAHASAANTTWRSPLAWSGAPDWKLDYANPTRLTPEALAPLRAEAEHARLTARALRDTHLPARAHPVQD